MFEICAQVEGLGRERRELEVGALDVTVKDIRRERFTGPSLPEDLVFFEFEVDAQALDDLRIGAWSRSPGGPHRPLRGCAARRGCCQAAERVSSSSK